jgi:hypothetical protein
MNDLGIVCVIGRVASPHGALTLLNYYEAFSAL